MARETTCQALTVVEERMHAAAMQTAGISVEYQEIALFYIESPSVTIDYYLDASNENGALKHKKK